VAPRTVAHPRVATRPDGNELGMRWFVGIYLVLGFLLAIGLYGWATVSSIRRHGFRSTVRGAG
jgi:hypothetical protein